MHTIILLVFIIGYLLIALEHKTEINKAAIALLTGVLCWVTYILNAPDTHHVIEELTTHLGEISGILFFLLGAMTIVELIDAHEGFSVITDRIKTNHTQKLMWIICLITFFLSAVLDNLTTTIVMISLVRKLVADQHKKWIFAGMIVIAANAGGAWTPIGDVTTTMLWIGNQITSLNIIKVLFIPSLVCILVPLVIISFQLKGTIKKPENNSEKRSEATPFERNLIFYSGIGALLFVPIFKTLTHLPPYMGIFFALGIVWIITELIHKRKSKETKDLYSVVNALQRIDVPSVLFFLGILLTISVLQLTGQLTQLAHFLDAHISSQNIIVVSIGLLSAVIDNVPLVAAAMNMYDLQQYPTDHYFWEFLAYCAGTGGSILIIGSAAGVAAMGIEKIDFFWYLKNIGGLAFMGYMSGAFVYIIQHQLFS